MSLGGNPSPWRNPKIILILLTVFLCGSAAGALGLRYVNRAPAQKNSPYWREGGKDISLQKFRKELDLTGDQAREVELVLDDFMKYYQTLQAQMDEVRANGKERILQILNPSQKDRFGRMMSDLQSKQIR
jgi:hypothetical protein